MRILIVDDSETARRAVSMYVRAEGFTPQVATDGKQAIQIVEHEAPDIVLTDLRMPELDGLQLVEYLREHQPRLPVILMTAHGSEDTAVQALRAGAASYVPKHDLEHDLREALRQVVATIEARRYRKHAREFLQESESRFVLGYEPEGPVALVSFLQERLRQVEFCSETILFQIGTALSEALANAIEHGNLELDSTLREKHDSSWSRSRGKRMHEDPYRSRKVHVTARLNRHRAIYVIRDEGSGFDYTSLPDPHNPENLLKASGRGIMLIKTFMDRVEFNGSGNQITMVKVRSEA